MNGDKVTCSLPSDPESAIPYEESTCHPAFKRSFLRVVLGRRLSHAIAQRWPAYKEEYCIECDQRPFEPGCKRVRQEYKTWWGKKYVVDHTSEVSEPVSQPEPGQSHAPHQQDATPPRDDVRADQLVAGAGHMQIQDT